MTSAGPLWQFHVSRRARERFDFDAGLFGFDGRVILRDLQSAGLLAEKLNDGRDLDAHPDLYVSAGELNAMGLLDETLHALLAHYRREIDGDLMRHALERLENQLGPGDVEILLRRFVDEFPPLAVFRGEVSSDAYLADTTDGVPHRQVVLEEILLLWLANANPASTKMAELFDDGVLRAETSYLRCIDVMRSFLSEKPAIDESAGNLLESLRAPVVNHPMSAGRQLEFIRSHWSAPDLVDQPVERVLSGLDLLAEENKPDFGPGPGPPVVLDFSRPPADGEDEWVVYEEVEAKEQYSVDRSWMPKLVLLAKNAHVWLAQLSRQHDTQIPTLDLVPDCELDRLAERGFTGLWLIGVWQRSRASRTIKRRMGDEFAVASAYSLEDYVVADDLGGEEAFDDLQRRALERGIRLSTDMVPNHVGLDSRWVVEHPDWFISSDMPPFPSYTFDGPDLSDDERVEIRLEDHYWDRSDAAVVFERVDRSSGSTRYIYHGNDGTSIPWNDTAQLDYRNPEVREAVLESILRVARRSPIIRFDAAMVLTKKNIHRLWFPEPGSGGDIPSRSQFSMTRKEFNQVMPNEFWREVVDAVAEEVPDTLLLAEAFWLLEGYFVRSLGMHRVYNSAFMNMLHAELNRDYRQVIKNTIEFDPEILQRFVNFMSNPDEETAIEQFGTGDKYFGVATLLVTMPGLPMIAHGQVEGLYEKYGMEFAAPRWHEEADEALIERHEAQIFPLVRRRELFAGAEHFELFDLVGDDGNVNDNTFAYSNRWEDESSLVIYNNSPHEAHGRIHASNPKRRGGSGGELQTTDLAHGLGLRESASGFLRARNEATGRDHLFAAAELAERGMELHLGPYELRVFLCFEVCSGDDTEWRRVLDSLGDRGSANLDSHLRELRIDDVLQPLAAVAAAVAGLAGSDDDRDDRFSALADQLAIARDAWNDRAEISTVAWTVDEVLTDIDDILDLDGAHLSTLLGLWLVLARMRDDLDDRERPDFVDDWCVERTLARALRIAGQDEFGAGRNALAVRLLLDWDDGLLEALDDAEALLELILDDEAALRYLDVHTRAGRTWFRREPMLEMLDWLEALVSLLDRPPGDEARALGRLRAAVDGSGYTLRGLKAAVAKASEIPDSPAPR